MNEKRNIDKLFEQGLKGYKPKAPLHAWDRLDHDLTMIARKRKFIFFRMSAATIALLFAFGTGYFIANYNNQVQDISSTDNPTQGQLTNNPDLQANNPDEKLKPKINDQDIVENKNPDVKGSKKNTTTFADAKVIPGPGLEKLIGAKNEPLVLNKNDDNTSLMEPILINNLHHLSAKNVLAYPQPSSITPRKSYNPGIVPMEVDHKETKRIEYGFEIPDKRKTINYKWAVGAQFAPTYSYRDISTDYSSGNAAAIEAEDNYNNAEEAMRSYSGGVNVDFHVTSRWMLQSGLYVSQIGQVNNDALQFVQNNSDYVLYAISTSTGSIDILFEQVPDDIKNIDAPKDTISSIDLSNVSIRQQFELFEVPFLIKYKLLNKKFSINLAGGLSPAYLLNNSTYLEVGNEKHDIGDASNLNSLIVNSTVGVGLEYLFTRKFSISFEPTFKYALSPINKNSQFYYHPYYFSLFTGIKYSF